jgi:hypothetical protein
MGEMPLVACIIASEDVLGNDLMCVGVERVFDVTNQMASWVGASAVVATTLASVPPSAFPGTTSGDRGIIASIVPIQDIRGGGAVRFDRQQEEVVTCSVGVTYHICRWPKPLVVVARSIHVKVCGGGGIWRELIMSVPPSRSGIVRPKPSVTNLQSSADLEELPVVQDSLLKPKICPVPRIRELVHTTHIRWIWHLRLDWLRPWQSDGQRNNEDNQICYQEKSIQSSLHSVYLMMGRLKPKWEFISANAMTRESF